MNRPLSKNAKNTPETYWQTVWNQFQKKKLGWIAFLALVTFSLVGIYAPFFASSQPLWLTYKGTSYFPFFRVLFYPGFYTKPLDLFFNVLIVILPIGLLGFLFIKKHRWTWFFSLCFLQIVFTILFSQGFIKNPNANSNLSPTQSSSWNEEVSKMTDYQKVSFLLKASLQKKQHQTLQPFFEIYKNQTQQEMPTLWHIQHTHRDLEIAELKKVIENSSPKELAYQKAKQRLLYIEEQQGWLTENLKEFKIILTPLFKTIHWEEDAGGQQKMNQFLPWWHLTRINQKDLIAALIFGIRIALVVGGLAVLIALCIGIPLGLASGYFAGKTDLFVCRFIEIWEAMPTFFMLLLIISITEIKSLFLVIWVLGLFGWPSLTRYMRAEVLKQRALPYVLATQSQGFRSGHILFSHILPNALPPILTLLPFLMMAAISSEAALSFLGLGEEGSTSWGVLMAEGRSVFPAESYLLWPPAILLTVLLVLIALVGDALRDAIDPRTYA